MPQSPDPSQLPELRKRIRETDEKILQLAAERMGYAREVGEIKLQHDLPIKDYQVEKQILETCRRRGRELGIFEDLAADLVETLIKYSCLLQEKTHRQKTGARASGEGSKVLVVGGLGSMGQWLAHFLDSFGHSLTLYDEKSDRQAAFPLSSDLATAAAEAEIIVLATPVTGTAGLIRQLTSWKTKALVVDVCSLKSPLLQAIADARKEGLRIASVHPMFGPQVDLLHGRNILICETGHAGATEEAAALFAHSTANLVRVPLAKHDELMAYILGVSHLGNLVFARALEQSGLPYSRLSTLGSTTFTAQARVTDAVVRENQDLYYEIQAENAYIPQLLEAYSKALASYLSAIRAKDREAFKSLMQSGRLYFEGATP